MFLTDSKKWQCRYYAVAIRNSFFLHPIWLCVLLSTTSLMAFHSTQTACDGKWKACHEWSFCNYHTNYTVLHISCTACSVGASDEKTQWEWSYSLQPLAQQTSILATKSLASMCRGLDIDLPFGCSLVPSRLIKSSDLGAVSELITWTWFRAFIAEELL